MFMTPEQKEKRKEVKSRAKEERSNEDGALKRGRKKRETNFAMVPQPSKAQPFNTSQRKFLSLNNEQSLSVSIRETDFSHGNPSA